MARPYAILYADFISKLYFTQNSKGIPFIEKLFEFDYDFFCHDQIRIEIERHCTDAKDWLVRNSNKIKVYTDDEILEMFKMYPLPETVALRYYMNHLKSACEIYKQDYFDSCYGKLQDNLNSKDDFLNELSAGDVKVSKKHNLGEVKNTVLMNTLYLCTKRCSYKFCSDDQSTRANVMAYAAKNRYDLKCISAFSFFFVAKTELGMPKDETDEYLTSWLHRNSDLRISVIEANGIKRTRETQQVYNDIWSENVSCTAAGYLKYLSN